MGKKQDEAGSSKASILRKFTNILQRVNPKTTKLPDKGRMSKKQARKPAGHVPLKSKPGFSLYTESEQEESKLKAATQKDIGSNKEQWMDVEKIDEREVEVLTQMQLQEEQMKSELSCLPSTSLNVPERMTPFGSFDLPDVSTPFNKRLVSSTPDPERLIEVDLLDQQRYAFSGRLQQQTQSKPTEAQMIPERDVGSMNMPDVLTSLGGGLSERLKHQRQMFQQQLLHNETCQKDLQKTHQDGPDENSFPNTMAKFGAAAMSQEQSKSLSPPLVVAKAEWVEEVQINDNINLAGMKKVSVPSKSHQGHHPLSSATTLDNTPTVQTELQAKKSSTMLDALENDSIIHSLRNSIHLHNSLESAFSIPEKIESKRISAAVKADDEPSLQTTDSSNFMGKGLKKIGGSQVSKRVNDQKQPHQQPHQQSYLWPHQQPHPRLRSATLNKQKLNTESLKEKKKLNLHSNARDRFLGLTEGDKVTQKNDNAQNKTASPASPEETVPDKVNNPIVVPTQVFDSSADTCDLEVSNVICEPLSEREIIRKEDVPEVKALDVSASSGSSHLSQVIEFLKSDAFHMNRDKQYESIQLSEAVSSEKSNETERIVPPLTERKDLREDESLNEIMSHYLPRLKSEEISSINNSQMDPVEEVDDLNATLKANEKEGGELEKKHKKSDDDLNQNYNSDSEDENSQQQKQRPRNLQYLESMPDPTLRDIACRLTFKATAIRDVELRDLIDDMIFHTDAALGRENARCKDSELYFSEESNKLKKRIQVLSQQLEAKEIEERMYVQSQKDVSQLERKNMFLKQEKEKLEIQVTNLLEERARWLTTQQDLVKTISMKDHELLKKNERYLTEKKSLLQALDQATQTSQGVHYKLSVADKQNSNLEQRLKCKDLEIDDYKEKLKAANEKLVICEANSLKMDLEMIRLQDLVDSLRIGVDHVLQAYEASTSHGTTSTQRQGIDNLRQMVHPEQYSSFGSMKSNYQDHNIRDEQRPATFKQPQPKGYKGPATSKKNLKVKLPIRPQPTYPKSAKGQKNSQETGKKDRSQKKEQCCVSTSRDEKRRGHIARLTPEVLEEHNRRLSPVDRTLWHSLDDGPAVPPVFDDEPYHSDSEIELHRESRHQRKHYSSQDQDHPYHDLVDDLKFSVDNERSRQHERDYIEISRIVPEIRERRKSESDLHGRYTNAEMRLSARSQAVENNEGLAAVPIIQSMEEVNISDGNYDRESHFKESEFLPNFNQLPARGTTGHPREVGHSREHQGGSVDTQYSTLRSETIPRSPVTSDDDRRMYLEDMTPYSTLRSEPLAKSPHRHDTSGKGKSHRSKSSYQEHELTHDLAHDSHQTKNDVYRHAPQENIYSSTHRTKVSEPQRLDNEMKTDSFYSALSQSQKSLTPHSSKETHPKIKKHQTSYQRPDFSHHEDHIPTCPNRSRDRRYLDNTNRDRYYLDNTNSLIPRDDTLVEPSTSLYPDRISHFQNTDHYDQHHSGFVSNQYQDTSRRYQFNDSDFAHLDFYKIKSNDRTREKLSHSPGHHHDNSRYTVKFDDNVTTDSPQNPRHSLDSQFFNGLSTLQTHSSPLCTSDTSFSRRATKGSTDNENISQRDFFQGTEFSESLSSISDTDQANPSFNNNGLSSMDDNAFTTGIAALDEKIANLQQKINRTKSIFS